MLFDSRWYLSEDIFFVGAKKASLHWRFLSSFSTQILGTAFLGPPNGLVSFEVHLE